MRQRDPLRLRVLADPHCVFDGAMAPADLGRILLGGVLRVVDEKVRTTDEFDVAQILPGDLPVACCQTAGVGLVVTGIHHRHPVGLQPISERERRMIQIAGGNLDIVYIEGALDEIVIANLSSALIECDREIGILHLPGQAFTERLAESLGAVYVPFVAGDKKWSEEWNALDMIPMGVADQDMAAQAVGAGRYQPLT
jgi:hypothetical protein